MPEIPFGYCQCGCGEKAKIAPKTEKRFGWVKGQPRSYLRGHQPKKSGSANGRWKGGRIKDDRPNYGYVHVLVPGHPRANAYGYVLEHVLVAERALGKSLPPDAVVHHVNGVRHDNRPQNLVVCQDTAYHQLLHMRMRAKAECGHADWRKCGVCKEYDDPAVMASYAHRPTAAFHRDCVRAKNRAYWARRKQREALQAEQKAA